MKNRLLYYSVFVLIFCLSCKKEKKDTTSPSVSIMSPASGAYYNMFDTVAVTVHVSDETHLTSATVALVDANNSVLQYTYNVHIESNDFTFTAHYVINNYHLESGDYYISVNAGDGTNSTQRLQKIHITESPTTRSGFFIVGATLPKSIIRYDNNFIQQSSISLTTGYNGMAFGPYYQMLYVNGDVNQSFLGYDIVTGAPTWTYPYSGAGSRTFECVASDGQKAFIGYRTGSVRASTYTGALSTAYSYGSSTYYPASFTITSKYGVGVYRDLAGGNDKVVSFARSSGMALNNVFMPASILGIFEHTADELYLAGNNTSGQAVFYLYTITSNVLQGPFNLPPGKLLSAALADSDHLILAMNNNVIYCYQYSNSNYTTLANITAQKIIYCPKMRELNAASLNSVYSYSLSSNYSLTQTGLNLLTDSIIGFEVITNK